MKKQLQNILSFAVFAAVMVFCGIGIQKTFENAVNPPSRIIVTAEKALPVDTSPSPPACPSVPEVQRQEEPVQATNGGWELKEPTEAAEFITGPLAADVGQLCVFRLNDPDTRADWVIVPEATCYVDSSGSSLAFASNISAKYSIIAAVVEDGVPKILTHICEYGLQPGPQPSPTPNPDPTPKPNPPPIITLKDWVSQNVPEAGKSKATALASCYESASLGIENDSIRSQEAAFSVIRTASQTKIDVEIWSTFLDGLAEKIVEKLDGSNDVKQLGTIFSEIAEGLKAVFVPETVPLAIIEEIVQPVLPPPVPQVPTEKPTVICPDPTGRACQPQPQTQYRRSR